MRLFFMPRCARIRVLALASALVLAGVSSAWAYTNARPESRFDAWAKSREGSVIAVAPRSVTALDPSDPLGVAWQAFDRDHGGGWTVYLDERTGMPTLVSGRGVTWFDGGDGESPAIGVLEAAARAFLGQNRVVLGNWADTMVFDEAASGEWREGAWQLVFRQQVDGVLDDDARLEFQVRDGRMTMFGAQKWGRIQIGGVPRIDAEDAVEVLDAYLGTPTAAFEQVGEPALAIVPTDPAWIGDGPRVWSGKRGAGLAHTLVWRLSFRDPEGPATWIAEVDARAGRVVAFHDGTHYASIRGGVFPVSPDGDCADGGCEIAGFPMPFVDFTETGQVEAFADTAGNIACVDPQASFETTLVGTHFEIRDECGPAQESGHCDTGFDFGTKAGENCTAALGASAGNTAAARTGYFQLNRAAEIARFYNPGNPWLEGRAVLNVNVNSTCNASWDGQVNMFRAGNGCGNTAEIQGVVVHEWAHGYDGNDGGDFDNTSEAYADVAAIFAARASCAGRGFFTDGSTCSGYGDACLTCTGIRDHDWAARTANVPATPQGFVQNNCPTGGGPCGYAGHCEAYTIGESIYDLAARDLPAAGLDPASAWQLAERLWYETRAGSGGDIFTCALPDSDSCAAGTWYQRMRNADDDDGNLANGTPHAAALFAAFDRHGIACGAVSDPENQSTSSCPALATPVLAVAQTPAGTELSWGAVVDAAEYLVYRGELGCDRQQVPIATVPGGATTWVDDVSDPGLPLRYRIEAIGANPACRSAVSNCEVAPDGPRLQRNGYRLIEDAVNSNGNGVLDPGETARIPVTLFNSGTQDAVGVAGRLRVVEPTLGRVIENNATWGDLAVYEEGESAAPHFEVTLFDAATCGSSVELEFEADASGEASHASRIRIPLGTYVRDFVNDTPRGVPNPGTITSQIAVDQAGTLEELDVSVVIDKFLTQDLIVELTSPANTTVRLLDQTFGIGGIDTRFDLERDPDGPGTMDDFIGESTLGLWTLSVQDVGGAGGGNGFLLGWTLHATVAEPLDCEPYGCPEAAPTEAPGGLTVDKIVDGGTGRIDLAFAWDAVSGVAGYHVLQSDGAGFDVAVDLAGRTAGATTLTVPDGAATSPPLSFFQVRSVNTCNQEAP